MTEVVSADLTGDGDVDLADLVVLGESWMLTVSDQGFYQPGDFNLDNVINNSDIDTLADCFGTSAGNTGFLRQFYYHFDQLGSVIAFRHLIFFSLRLCVSAR